MRICITAMIINTIPTNFASFADIIKIIPKIIIRIGLMESRNEETPLRFGN